MITKSFEDVLNEVCGQLNLQWKYDNLAGHVYTNMAHVELNSDMIATFFKNGYIEVIDKSDGRERNILRLKCDLGDINTIVIILRGIYREPKPQGFIKTMNDIGETFGVEHWHIPGGLGGEQFAGADFIQDGVKFHLAVYGASHELQIGVVPVDGEFKQVVLIDYDRFAFPLIVDIFRGAIAAETEQVEAA